MGTQSRVELKINVERAANIDLQTLGSLFVILETRKKLAQHIVNGADDFQHAKDGFEYLNKQICELLGI